MSKQKPKYTLIKFLSRDASNYNTDKAIAKMKNSPLKRDVALVASNKKHVEAHAFVLMLFSPKFAELLENFDASNGRQLSKYFREEMMKLGICAVCRLAFCWKPGEFSNFLTISWLYRGVQSIPCRISPIF